MLVYWTMPCHREPMWIEHIIDSILHRIGTVLSRPIRDTAFEYWLLNSQGQVEAMLFTLILSTLAWLIALEYLTPSEKRIPSTSKTPTPEGVTNSASAEKPTTPRIHQSDKVISTSLTGDTLFMQKLAPPGHRPTNADLGISPFQIVRPLCNRTSPISTPGRQTPFAKYCQGRNFSGLAPVSYKSGMLDKQVSPKKKRAASKHLTLDSRARDENVVAWWVNDTGKKGGRASMHWELK